MNNKQRKRQRDIKNKLMAAICMLLVSSIMMVSSTYAWFTLSTAPEVTGINTAVGANGNLEMALLPLTGDVNAITSGTEDSALPLVQRNVTWGNLVDLSDNNSYGMDKITLYPAALNAATEDAANNPETLAAIMLKTPVYGADGRVSSLAANTTTSTYVVNNFPQNTNKGVRAVGTASGMTDRQLAYRNSRSAANTAMSQAKAYAAQSLNVNGASLANIAIKHAADANATHTQAEVASLLAIVDDLLGKDGKKGVLQYIDEAYVQNIIALGAADNSGMTDEQFALFQAAVTGAADLDGVLTALASVEGANTVVSYFQTYATKLNTTKQNVTDAKTGLTALKNGGSETIAWSDLSTPLNKLANPNTMKINGFAANTFRENMSAIINAVAGGQGLVVSIATGGGVYADVADHCGDFTASIKINEVTYNGMTLNNVNARMQTETTVNPVYLSVVQTAVTAGGEPTSEGGQAMPITDMFGYVIDLAFRTNAAESNLLLQKDAADRIYDSGTEATMGHGSTMTFTSTTTDFTTTQMTDLMKAIRIVFFNPDTNGVLATAKLNMDAAETTGGNTVTAKMYLYEMSNGGYVQEDYAESSGKTYYTREGDQYTQVDDNTAKSAGQGTLYVLNPAGEVEVTDNVITPLTQNTAQKVSVLVYLDGNYVDNGDVAATAGTSMTGTMNLQFASSATLVPMEYTPLMQQGATTMSNVSVTGNAAAAGSFVGDNVTITLTANEGYQIDSVDSVTVGGAPLNSGDYTYSGGKVTFTKPGIAADTAVVITVTTSNT